MNNVRDKEPELDLHQENFYNKLMALKKEHERHIKLVEKVYFSGVTKESQPYREEQSESAKTFSMPYFKVLENMKVKKVKHEESKLV